jgi:hypothetical protein
LIEQNVFQFRSSEPTAFTAFLQTVFGRLAENTVDGSIHQICMDWRHMSDVAVDRNIVRRIRKDEFGLGAFQQAG